jgi:hypothetical protein
MTAGEPDELDKIANLAVQRGYWDARAALEGVAIARKHTAGPQKIFLRKLLERTCGLTYDELARLEKDALAAPVSQTPSKPLPRLGSAKPASNVDQSLASADVVIPRAPEPAAPPPAPAPVETYTPPPRQEEIITTVKKLPKLDEKKSESKADEGGQQIVMTPKPLPRLNAPKKKPEEPPPA